MIRRHWPALSVVAVVLAAGLNLRAEPVKMPPAATPPPLAPADVNVKELIARQAAQEQQYKAFTRNLLALAQKFEKSERIEDKDKALALRKAIDLADKEGVDNKFRALLNSLTKNSDLAMSDITAAAAQNKDLVKALRDILTIIQSDDELERIKQKMRELEALLAELNSLLRSTRGADARVNSGRGDNKIIAKQIKEIGAKVDVLATKMGAKGAPKATDPKAGEKKPSDGKGDAGEGKDDAKEKKGEAAKGGDPKKDDKGGESKAGKGPMDGDGAKGGKPGDPKEGMGGGKGMGGEPKDPMKDPMATTPKADKPAESRNKEDNKGDEKGAAAKGDPKAGGKSDGSPMGGQPGDPKPGGSPSSGSPPPSSGKPPAPGAEKVRSAVPDEEAAASAAEENKRKTASDELVKAAEKLDDARKELEKRLKQLREQELERLLANLEARVNKMLAMQIEVKGATVAIFVQVQKNEDMKAKTADFQNAQKQEDKEAEIIADADKAIALLQNEGSAVAFPAVFEEVRKDMARVKERLHDANVTVDTQLIEQDIIDTLTQMRDALKKAQQELGKQPPPPPGGGPPPPTQLQKLLDEIAELKMIKQLQIQVNTRTKRYGEKNPVEQAEDTQIKKELRDLGDRQEKIESMVNAMVTKKNQ